MSDASQPTDRPGGRPDAGPAEQPDAGPAEQPDAGPAKQLDAGPAKQLDAGPADDEAYRGGQGVPLPPREDRPSDPNLVAVSRAELPSEMAEWLREVAAQVDPRLDRVAPDWRTGDQAEAARACVFGMLLGYLGRTYPHVRSELAAVAEVHPSFGTLERGSRLATLEQIVADPQRVTAWLGPLIDVDDPERMRAIIE